MNKRHLLVVSFTLLMGSLFLLSSCSKKGSIAAAREHMAKKEYGFAGENYRKVYSSTKKKDEKIESANTAAFCYWKMNDMKNAESWYRKAIKVDPKNAENQYMLAKTLKNNGKYSEAIIEFNNYLKLSNEKGAEVERMKQGCENALKWKNDKTRYQVENVKALNTRWEDFAPQWFKKDQLYFTSDREKGVSSTAYGWTTNSYTDLYAVTFKVDKKNPNNITYQLPALVDKKVLNGELNDGVVAFDARFITDDAPGVRKRISQRAVQDIGSVGGSSFIQTLQGKAVALFKDFGYRRIGIGCHLENQICAMNGLHSAGNTFTIVEGAGVPRLDVVGYN
ncbi:MAG: tetratricopeptide repeat protein, partial [Bacteroidetes bacterium]|nr:tetratricopeptide repeat protein [Bacteroidota bacterium]